jgi:hypothetical protein
LRERIIFVENIHRCDINTHTHPDSNFHFPTSYELAFTFHSFSFPAPALENISEKKRRREEKKKWIFEHERSGTRIDENAFQDVKMNCLFIDNTL